MGEISSSLPRGGKRTSISKVSQISLLVYGTKHSPQKENSNRKVAEKGPQVKAVPLEGLGQTSSDPRQNCHLSAKSSEIKSFSYALSWCIK